MDKKGVYSFDGLKTARFWPKWCQSTAFRAPDLLKKSGPNRGPKKNAARSRGGSQQWRRRYWYRATTCQPVVGFCGFAFESIFFFPNANTSSKIEEEVEKLRKEHQKQVAAAAQYYIISWMAESIQIRPKGATWSLSTLTVATESLEIHPEPTNSKEERRG